MSPIHVELCSNGFGSCCHFSYQRILWPDELFQFAKVARLIKRLDIPGSSPHFSQPNCIKGKREGRLDLKYSEVR